MAERDQQPVGALLDGLTAKTRRSLAEAGFDLPRLRELASTPQGERQVRHIVTEFGLVPVGGGPVSGAFPAARREVARPWALVVLGAVAGLAAVLAVTVLVDRPLGLLVAVLAAAGTVVLLVRTPRSRGRDVAVLVALAAVVVLFLTAFMNAPQWYLAARGKQTNATVVEPDRSWSHGSRIAYCRVRLPDGSVHQVDTNNRTCATDVGATAPVVYDPGGHMAPTFGTRHGLGRTSRFVAAGAGVVLIGTAAGTVVAAGRRKGMR